MTTGTSPARTSLIIPPPHPVIMAANETPSGPSPLEKATSAPSAEKTASPSASA